MYVLEVCHASLPNIVSCLYEIRECITCHPSFSDTVKITKIYQLTESSSFDVKGDSIEFKGDETFVIVAKNDIEHQHWCYALDLAINRLRKVSSKVCELIHLRYDMRL